MAAQIDMGPAKPRAAGRQKHRGNTPAETVDQYFLRNMAIPFLDHIIAVFEAQFSGLTVTSSLLLGLVPSVSFTQDITIDTAVNMYRENLPSPELMEGQTLEAEGEGKSLDNIPAPCAAAITTCDPVLYPNILMLLKII